MFNKIRSKHLFIVIALIFQSNTSVAETEGQWTRISLEQFPFNRVEATNGQLLTQDSSRVFIFENENYRLVQRIRARNANRGTSAYKTSKCGLPCSTDYRCYGYNYVNTSPKSIKLYFDLTNAFSADIDFWDEFGFVWIDGDSQPCGGAHTQGLYYSKATAYVKSYISDLKQAFGRPSSSDTCND